MKKLILFFAFSSILSLGLHAQGLYLGAGFGYGFRAGSMVVGSNENSNGSSEVVKGSLGKGMYPNLAVGYLFTDNLGAELNFGYLIGTKTKVKDEEGTGRSETTFNAQSFYINPSFVIRANSEMKVVPYGKVGVFLGLANSAKNVTDETNYNFANTTIVSTEKTETKYKGHLSTGITAAAGVDFMLSEHLAVFGELNARLATWAPASYTASSDFTPYVGGVAQASQPSSVSGNFVKEMPAGYVGTDRLQSVLPFSSVGFNVGVRIYFLD